MKPLKGTLLAIAFLFSACTPSAKEAQSETDQVKIRAYRLIDSQRADEAILVLEKQLEITPNSTELKTVLASAYAHSAGVRMHQFLAVLSRFQNKSNEISSLKVSTSKKQLATEQRESEESLEKTLKILSQTQAIIQALNDLPTLSSADEVKLQYAIQILSELSVNISQEDALYRGLLRLVLVKSSLQRLTQTKMKVSQATDGTCEIDTAEVSDNMNDFVVHMILLYQDLGLGQPKMKEHYLGLQQDLEVTNSTIQNNLTAVTSTSALYSIWSKEWKAANDQREFSVCTNL